MKKESTQNLCETCKRPIYLGDEGWLHDEPTITCVAKGPAIRLSHSYPQPVTLSRLNARINARIAKEKK